MIPDKLNIRVPRFSKAAGPSLRLLHLRRVCGGVARFPGEPRRASRAAAGLRGGLRGSALRCAAPPAQPVLSAASERPAQSRASAGRCAPAHRRRLGESPRHPAAPRISPALDMNFHVFSQSLQPK